MMANIIMRLARMSMPMSFLYRPHQMLYCYSDISYGQIIEYISR